MSQNCLQTMVQTFDCYLLTYSDLEQAITRLNALAAGELTRADILELQKSKLLLRLGG